jgi:hypothetical protein
LNESHRGPRDYCIHIYMILMLILENANPTLSLLVLSSSPGKFANKCSIFKLLLNIFISILFYPTLVDYK